MAVSARTWTLVVFGTFASSILIAIWVLPGFLVQYGPLYLYNTRLMLELTHESSPFHQYFTMNWKPMPYWGAYAVLGGMMAGLPARTADQVLMSLTSVGVASTVMWLRWR